MKRSRPPGHSLKRQTVEGVIYSCLPRSLSDYVKSKKKLGLCKSPTPFPRRSDSLGHTRLTSKDPGVKTARGEVFFTIVGNCNKCNLNEVRHTLDALKVEHTQRKVLV